MTAARPRLAGPDGARADAAVNFTLAGGNALSPNLKANWTGSLTVAKPGTYWTLSAGTGHRRQPFHRRQAGGVTGPSRAMSMATSCRPTRTMWSPPPTGWTMSAMPSRSARARTPSASPSARTPPPRRSNSGLPGTRRVSARPITRRRSTRPGAPRSRWCSSGPGERRSSCFPANRPRWSRKSPRSTRTPSSCSTPASPSPVPWAGKVKAMLQMWWPGDEGGWATADLLLGRPIRPAACR